MASLAVDRVLVAGRARGPALVLDQSLSFWGGLDAETGLIVDQRHPQVGRSVTGTVLVMWTGRGSSSAASVLAEAIRAGTAPLALVMQQPDEIIVLGAIIAEEMYGITMPMVLVSAETLNGITTGQTIEIDEAAKPE
ncbi:MAG: aconitase X swivel domain-containing protein [Acidimicrobiales bacterium]